MASHDIYADLQNIMRLVHPNTMKDTSELQMTKQVVFMYLPTNDNKFIAFLEIEDLKVQNFTKYYQFYLVLHNILSKYIQYF